MKAFFPLFLIAVLGATPQSPDQARLLELARNGKAAEAWTLWKAMPVSADRSRAGVWLAAETRDITRGVELYGTLVTQTGAEDPTALQALATGAAVAVVTAPDQDVRLGACGVVLEAGVALEGCQKQVAAVQATADAAAQAVAIFRLANAGYRPWPDLLQRHQDQMSTATRLDIASRFTRLPASLRVDLISPIFDRENDRAQLAAAAALLGDIAGAEAFGLLSRVNGRQNDLDLKIALALALARHGDAASAKFVQEMRSSLVGPRQVDAGVALALAGSPYGPDPKRLLETTPGVERARLAVALAPRHPDAAKAAIIGMLGSPTPELRAAGLRAAGLLRMGGERPVYARLTDTSPMVQLAAVDAILQTFAK